MATATTTVRGVAPGTKLRVGSLIMAIGGAGFIGYAVIFFTRNFTGSFLELGIGHGEVNVNKTQIKHFSPSLYDYISHLHIALSGFIAASGLAVIALAWFGVRRGLFWAWVTAVAVPVLALAVALPAHYPNHLDAVRGRRRGGVPRAARAVGLIVTASVHPSPGKVLAAFSRRTPSRCCLPRMRRWAMPSGHS